MAKTNTWKVNAGGDWGTAADWSLGTAPGSGDNVVINTANIQTITFSYGDVAVVNSLTVGNDAFVMTGGALTVLGAASFAMGLTQSGGALQGGSYTLQATSVITGGSETGASVITNKGTLSLSNYLIGGSASIVNASTLNLTGQITIGDATGVGALINNQSAGTVNVAGDFGVTAGASSASISNAGLFEKGYGIGTSTIGVSFANTGTLQATSGILALAGPVNTIGGVLKGAGEIAFSGGVTNLAAGVTDSVASLGLLGNGVLNLGGATALTALQDSAGYNQTTTLNIGAYALTLKGQNNFSGGGAGSQAFVSGVGQLATTGATNVGGSGMTIGGTVAWNNSGVVTDAAQITIGDSSGAMATLTNAGSGAVFNLVNGGGIGHGQSTSSTFTNSAKLTKTGDGSTSTISADFKNTGTVTIIGSTLDLQGPINTLAGTVAGSTGTLIFDGQSQSTLVSGVSLGVGTIDVYTAAALLLPASVSYAGTLNDKPAFGQSSNIVLQGGSTVLSLSGQDNFSGGFGGSQAFVSGAGQLATSGTTTIGGSGMTLGGSATWSNTGTVVENSQLTLGDSGGSPVALINAGGSAIYNLATNAGIGIVGSTASTFTNSGLLEKTGGAGVSVLAASLNNTGTISVAAAQTLDLAGTVNAIGGKLSGAGALVFDGSSQSTLVSGVSLGVATIDVYASASLFLPTSLSYAGNLNDDPAFAQSSNIALQNSSTILTLSGQDTFVGGFGGSQAVVSGAGQLATTGATNVGGSGLTIGGTVAWNNSGVVTDAAQITIGDSSGAVATLTNSGSGAVFNLVNGGGIGHGQSTSSTFTNSAKLTKTGDGSTSTISADFRNTGTVTITNGTLDLQGPINTLAGAVNGPTGTLVLDGSSSTTLGAGLALSVGTTDLNGSTTALLSSNLSYAGAFNDTASFAADTTFNLNGHSLTLAGAVDLRSSTGGSEDVFTGGGLLATSGTTTTENDGAQFEGTTGWSNTGTVNAAGQLVLGDSAGHVSTVTNGASGVYDLKSDAGVSLGSSFFNNSKFVNNGQFEKTQGSGTSVIGSLLVNNGTITVTSGTVEILAGLYSGSGAINGVVTYDASHNMFIGHA